MKALKIALGILLLVFFVALLSGCASEYSSNPEATGEWVAANPPEAPPPEPAKPVYHRRWTRR